MRIAFNPSTVAALIAPPNNKDITFDLRGQNIFARGVKFCGTDTNTWRDIKINNVSIDSNTLDLRDGDNTTLTNINGVVTINSTWRPVVDNLTSDSTTSSLSANLGRVLKALIDGKSDSDHNHDDRYLRLTGGLMLGDITFGGDNKIIWGRNTDSASISFKNDGDGDADSYMSFVTSDNGNEYFRWSHSSGSTNTEWMSLRSDGLRVGGTKVSLEGHTHDDRYVKRSGDTMLGALNFANNTWNKVGDDVYMGDHNIGGQLCIMGANGTTGLSFHKYGDASIRKSITFDGNTLYMNGSCDYATLSNLTNLLAINTVPNKTTSTSIGSWSPISGRYVFHQKWTDTSTGSDSADFGIYLDGNLTANIVLDGYYNSLLGFRVIGATGGFLKANGTIDNSTYLTSHLSLSNYYTKSEVDTKLNSKLNYRLFWERTNIDLNSITEAWHTYEVNNGLGTANTPTNASWHLAVLWGTGDTDYAVLLCTAYTSNYSLYLRHKIAGKWYNWIQLAATTDIPSSLKNPYALTISLNGTSQGPYDGSAAKNINITPSSIGAATSDHNHDGRYVYNYGGTTNVNSLALNQNALFMSTTSGITEDWWHILQAAWNDEYRWNSLIAFPTLNRNGMYYRSGLDDNTAWGAWVKLLDTNNYASILDSRYYTESEVNNLLTNYYPITGGNMSGDNRWIGSTMGGGSDYWRIGGKGSDDTGTCIITIGDNYNDKFAVEIADWQGSIYRPLEVIYAGINTLNIYVGGTYRLLYSNSANGSVIHSILNYSSSPYGLLTRIYNTGVVSLQSLRESNNGELFGLSLQPLGGNVGIGTINPPYKLTIEGVGDDKLPVQLISASRDSTWVYNASFLAPNLTSNHNNAIFIGKAHNTCNAFGLTHMHIKDGSASNYAALEVWGVGNVLRWYYDRHSAFLHRADFSSLGSDASYMNSALLIREHGYNGTQADTWANAPRMSWHWSGRVQTQIGLGSNNELYLSKNNFGNAYRLMYETGTWGINISGNADTIDGYHISDESRQVYKNHYTVDNPAGAWILIKFPAWNAVNEIITISGYGDNRQAHCVVYCGSRYQGIWGYQSDYNGTVVDRIGWKEVDSGKFALVALINEGITTLRIRATNSLEISKTTEGGATFVINSNFFSSGGVFHGNVDWDKIIGKPSSFTPSEHTHSWTSITDKIVAGNEFNIVNAGFNSDMYFNYLPINDRNSTAYINSYIFGNGHQGLALVLASGFIKNGSSSNYVLLGDGGHKAISDFAPSSHSHNYAANENYGGFTKSERLPISGFYQSCESESGGNAPWSSWMHLINCLHSNTGNNYALLIAASFYDNNTFKIRVTDNNINNDWRDIIHSGNIGYQTVNNAYHLRINSANTWSTWYWAGLSGLPSWLWGSNDGTNMYVWDPNNFNVHTALYLRSLGNLNCQTGRTLNYGDVYSYNTYDGNTDSPTSYTSIIGFGRGIAGTVEIAGGWCNTGLYWRSLRDCCDDWYSWRTVLDSSNYTEFINNYYWANVKISASANTQTQPSVNTIYANNWFRSQGYSGWYNESYGGGIWMNDSNWIKTYGGKSFYCDNLIYSSNSIKMSNILLEHTDEINNSANGSLHLNYRSSGNITLCIGGGNVGISNSSPSYKLDVNGLMRASGFHHGSINSDNYILLAGGGYKSFGGDYDNPIFLGYLNLEHGNDGTVSSSFYCLGHSVSFTYTRGGNYCKISIPDTSYQVFYIKAAIASVNYSGGGMDTWVGEHRADGAWWLHCYAYSSNEVRVKGFHLRNDNNDSWWGGNPLWSSNGGANRITVCIFGYVTFR